MKFNTAQEIADWIKKWEHEAGESFTDYFLHDTAITNDWVQLLRDKGFDTRAQIIAIEQANGNLCICQQLLFNVNLCYVEYNNQYKEYVAIDKVEYENDSEKWDELYDQDLLLWGEFILSDSHYLETFMYFVSETEDSK